MNTHEGNIAPDFQLSDEAGKMHSLKDYSGKYVLLYFYPKDDTPGCTVEACAMRDRLNDLNAAGVQVLGVSADDEKSHSMFKEKHRLNFPLLADVNKKVIQEYGVWKEKSMYGKIYMGISRESFLIGPDGKIVKHYEKVKPEQHAEEVLEDVGTLRGKG